MQLTYCTDSNSHYTGSWIHKNYFCFLEILHRPNPVCTGSTYLEFPTFNSGTSCTSSSWWRTDSTGLVLPIVLISRLVEKIYKIKIQDIKLWGCVKMMIMEETMNWIEDCEKIMIVEIVRNWWEHIESCVWWRRDWIGSFVLCLLWVVRTLQSELCQHKKIHFETY
jgi:hypothetical protein